VRQLPEQKRTQYYCMLMDDYFIPAVDFLSASHTTERLASILDNFSSCVRRVNNGRA
jgi:hypothetical protein